jgi:hypothetical protein
MAYVKCERVYTEDPLYLKLLWFPLRGGIPSNELHHSKMDGENKFTVRERKNLAFSVEHLFRVSAFLYLQLKGAFFTFLR